MAQNSGNIVKKAIQIDATTSVRTVKSLKQEINSLRDELLNLDKDTKEYEDTQKQLQQDVEDLNTVMSAHKDRAEALEGSYNDLQNQLKELKAAWKETNDEAQRDELGEKIKSINDQLKEMDASIGDYHRNVGNYASAWEGLSSVMDKGEKVTDDLEKGIKAFGSAMGLSDKQVNALSKSLKSLKDGFKIAKDIAKAKENTETLSTSQKAAAGSATAMATAEKSAAVASTTMATAEGTAAVATKGLSVAMRGLKVALMSTGIGALIIALGELIALLDKSFSKAKQARLEAINSSTENQVSVIKEELENIQEVTEAREFDRRKMEAAGATAIELLEQEKEDLESLRSRYEDNAKVAQRWYEKKKEFVEKLPKKRQEEYTESLEELKSAWDAATDALKDFDKEVVRVEQDIEIQKIKDAHKATEKVTEEIKKWSDLVKDPKFQADWKALFSTDFEGNSPIEVLNAQKEAATALVNKYKGDASEVERYFEQLISEAKAEWQSLVDKEQQIFDERLTPAERLEREKQEWIDKANKWGMETVNLANYYDDKIQAERDKAADEALQKQKDAEQKSIDEYDRFMSEVEQTLSTNERLYDMFNPIYMDTTSAGVAGSVAGEIQREMDNLKGLYDAQMQYLNGLLESAELTEEAYAGVESRILELSLTFNRQMEALKKEQDFQGKNFALISKKWVQNMSLMETATGSLSEAVQDAGYENSVAFKAFATAQALISTYLAANRVMAEEAGGLWVKIAAAAAITIAGLANVYAIWNTNADGSNASPSSSIPVNATPVIGNSTPINYTRNITSAEEQDELNKPIYVQVVDIEDGLDGRKAQVTNTSF